MTYCSIKGRRYRKASPERKARILAAQALREFYQFSVLGTRYGKMSPAQWPALPEIDEQDMLTLEDRLITGEPRRAARFRVLDALKRALVY